MTPTGTWYAAHKGGRQGALATPAIKRPPTIQLVDPNRCQRVNPAHPKTSQGRQRGVWLIRLAAIQWGR